MEPSVRFLWYHELDHSVPKCQELCQETQDCVGCCRALREAQSERALHLLKIPAEFFKTRITQKND